MGSESKETVVLQASPLSVAEGRRFIGDRVTGARSDDARLVVSELITNALIHSRGALRLTSVRHDDELCIEVWDCEATAVPEPREADDGMPGGRGLQIVAMLCSSWGHRSDPPGKTVWGTIDLTDD